MAIKSYGINQVNYTTDIDILFMSVADWRIPLPFKRRENNWLAFHWDLLTFEFCK